MIAEYLMKGIDSLFNDKLTKGFASNKSNGGVLSREPLNLAKDSIRRNLHKVVRFTPMK
jgi:hypothetical protein